MDNCSLLLLFLLLLRLKILGQRRWRGAADCHGGGHVFVGGRVCKGDSHRDAEFAFGSAFEYAPGGRDFGIIASNGNANVAFASEDVVGGIEFSPAESRQQGLEDRKS